MNIVTNTTLEHSDKIMEGISNTNNDKPWALWDDYTIDNKDDFISEIIDCGHLMINQYHAIMNYDTLVSNDPHKIGEIEYIRLMIKLSNIKLINFLSAAKTTVPNIVIIPRSDLY